jgi:hypothetical protein
MTKRRLTLAIILTAGLVVLLVTLGLRSKSVPDKTVAISGITQCSVGIDGSVADHLGVTLYGYVLSANNYNHHGTSKNYRGAVRSGSCEQAKSKPLTDASGDRIVVKTSSVIVDIPTAKQPWKITYDWVQKGDAGQTDLGTLQPTCLPNDQLRYGDFSCDTVLSVVKYGTPYYDPILQYMPYVGDGFTLNYTPKTKQVVATMLVPAEQKGNDELIKNDEAIIPYWFERRGLNQNNYTITYRVVYQ